MPNRILRDWTDSFTLDSLDANEERFFVRLIMKVDDYGRFFSDLRLLRANLFPLKTDIRDSDISRWLTACETAGLIVIYNVANKGYLQITNFKQTLRQKKEKFPAPGTCIADAQHTHIICVPETKRNETESREEKEVFRPLDLSKSNLFREPIIPAKSQVLEVFLRNGGTKEMAKAFWDRNESTGWFYKNSPITNFANMVGSFVENWKRNEQLKKPKNEIDAHGAAIAREIEKQKADRILNGK